MWRSLGKPARSHRRTNVLCHPRYHRDGGFHPADHRFHSGEKLAEGLDALVMDVKVGSGAFMPTYELSEALAEAIVGVANGAGVRTTALLTDMNGAGLQRG